MNVKQNFLSRLYNQPVEEPVDETADTEVQQDDGADRSAYEELEHTQRTAADSPINRGLFWVLTVSAAAVALWFFGSKVDFSAMNSGNPATQPIAESDESQVDEAIALDVTEGELAFAEQDVDQANATALLDAEQRAEEYEKSKNKVNLGANETTATPPLPRTTPATVPATPPRAAVTNRNTVAVPRRTYNPSRRAYTPPSRGTQPIRRTAPPPAAKPSPVAPSPVAVQPEVDAAQLYASFDNIGSYGSADQSGERPTSQGNQNQASNASFTNPPGAVDDGFLSGVDQDVYMVPGETLELTLNLPIFWSGAKDAPLTLATVTKGNEYLPVGTRLSVSASGDSSGLVQISQLAIIDGNSTIPLSGAMQITKPDGKPLKAKKKGGSGFFSKIGVKTLLGLGASVAGNALSGDTVTINNGSTSVQQDRGILSSVLESGSNELLGELRDRSNDTLDRQQGQEYFIVESGKNIKVSAVSNVGG